VGSYNTLSEAAKFTLRNLPYQAGVKGNLTQFAKLINTFDSGLQEMIILRARQFAEKQDALIAQGVPVEVLETPINAIIGLQVLQLAEESGKHLIKESSLRKGKLVGQLTENLENQKRLVKELRTAMNLLENTDLTEGSQNFFKMIKSAEEFSSANIAQLELDINIIEKNGVKYYKGMIEGDVNNNLSVAEIGDVPSVFTKMDEALNNLAKKDIKKYSVDDIKGIADQRKSNQLELQKTVQDKAVDLLTKGDVTRIKPVDEAAIDVEYAVDVKKLQRKDKGEIQVTNTTYVVNDGIQEASDLFAILLESKHVDELARFDSLYNRLSGTLINPSTGETITGKVRADGGRLLDAMFDILRKAPEDKDDDAITLLIERINNSTVSKGHENKIFNILEETSDNFFTAKARNQNKTLSDYKEELTEVMNEAVDNGTHTLIKDVSNNIQLLNFIRSTGKSVGKEPQLMPFTLEQMRAFRTAFGQLANKTKNAQARSKFVRLDRTTDEIFNKDFNVELDDGSLQRLDGLALDVINPKTNTQERMSVIDYLRAVDDEYFNFKRRFYDKGFISDRMGWNSKRLYVEPSLQNRVAIGLDTNIPTNKWLDLDDIVNKKSEVDRANIGNAVMSALGSKVGKDFVLKQNTPEADVFKTVLEAAYGQWLLRNAVKSTPQEIIEKSEKIAKSFNFVDDAGQQIQVFDWRDVVDESLAFNTTNFADETIKKGEDIYEQAIRNIVDQTVQSAKKVKKDAEDVKRIIQNFSSLRIDDEKLADELLGGGQVRLDAVIDALKKTGKTDEEITKAIYEVIGQAIDDKTFRRVGTYSMDLTNKKIYPDLDLDIDALKKFAGFENPQGARAKAFTKVVGEKRAKFYESMIEFLELRKLEGQPIYGLRNAARAFSLESYISRFYSIQRGVISARYVGTEAILQQYRLRGASAFKAMLNDPKAGQAFLEIIKSGKQLDPKADKSLFNMLVKYYAANKDMFDNMEQRGVHGNILNIPKVALQGIRELRETPVLEEDKQFGGYKYPEFLTLPPEKESGDIREQMLNIRRQQRRRRGQPNENVQ
jgi:hypothetical protein